MPEKAHVTSVEAIKSFRENVIIYLGKARPVLEEVSGDVLRTRVWLEVEQRNYWESQLKRRTRRLEEAKANLFGAKMSSLREVSAAEQSAVHKAKLAVEEAEGKLRIIKQWSRDFENRTQPLVKQMEKLHSVLAEDLPNATAYLAEALNTLEAYASIGAPSASAAPPPAGSRDAVGEAAKPVQRDHAQPERDKTAGEGDGS